MADLIQEFFERELSGPEADSLGTLLQESPDEALRFEGLLENHYLATGLPLPQLPASLQNLPLSPGGMGAMGGWKLFALLVVAGAGFALWKYWPGSQTLPAKAALAPVASISQPVFSAPAKPQPVHPRKADPAAVGEELSVVVGAAEKTLVTVRVLDAEGKEVRDLYTGFISPGHWSFQWDGLLSAGAPAPTGNYQIDVQAGALHQTKDVHIQSN
jgi:hypothetical protein